MKNTETGNKNITKYAADKKGKISSWIYLAAACIYVVSQIDFVPDMPVVGWFDDIFIFLSAFINFIQHQFIKTDTYFYKLCKILRNIFIALAAMTFLLFVLLLVIIFRS